MGKIMRNGVLYGAGGDDAFRYVNDVTDENYGWIQYRLEDGGWVNYEEPVIAPKILYSGTENEANFKGYEGGIDLHHAKNPITPSVTIGESMYIQSDQGETECSLVSDPIDFTKWDRLCFTHASTTGFAGESQGVVVGLVADLETMTPVVSRVLLQNGTSASGGVSLDVSDVIGVYHVVITISSGSVSAGYSKITTSISNMYVRIMRDTDINYVIKNGALNDGHGFTAYGDTSQTVTEGDNGVTFTKYANSTYGYFQTDDLYDTSKYTRLVFTVSEYSTSTPYVALIGRIGYTGPMHAQKLFDSVGSYDVDLTSINEPCCVMICLPTNGTRRITLSEMYFE